MALTDLTIGKKLILGFLVVAVLVLITGLIGYNAVSSVGAGADRIMYEKVPIADNSMELTISFLNQWSAERGYLLNRDSARSDYDTAGSDFMKLETAMGKLSLDASELATLAEAKAAYTTFDTAAKNVMQHYDEEKTAFTSFYISSAARQRLRTSPSPARGLIRFFLRQGSRSAAGTHRSSLSWPPGGRATCR